MTALYIVSCVFDAFVIYLLFEDILGKRKSSVNKWILMLALLAQQFISSLILNKTQSVYARLIVMIVGTFLLTIFYETDLVKRFFAMAVFIVFSIIAEGIAEVLMALLGITKGEEEEIIALFLVEIFLLLLVLFKKIFTKREGNIPIKYQVGFLIVPVLSVVVINGMVSGQPTISWLFGVISLLILNMVSYYLLNTLTGYITEQSNKEQMERQIKTQKEKYEQLASSFVQGNRLIHDVNKHNQMIKKYLEESDYEEAINYIEKIDDSFAELYSSVNTGNLVVDSIIGGFKERLEQIGCAVELSVKINKNRKIMDDYDLVVVLGNVTDNIIEAVTCGEKKRSYVEMKLEMTHTSFVFYAKNSVSSEKKKEKNKWFHGLGLSNVKDTVENYGGTMLVSHTKESYETMIQVPIREE